MPIANIAQILYSSRGIILCLLSKFELVGFILNLFGIINFFSNSFASLNSYQRAVFTYLRLAITDCILLSQLVKCRSLSFSFLFQKRAYPSIHDTLTSSSKMRFKSCTKSRSYTKHRFIVSSTKISFSWKGLYSKFMIF